MDFYIAYEVDNPLNTFFYKPIEVSTNLLKALLLEEKKLNPYKRYKFYFNLDGVNFSFIGKPVEIKDKEITLMIEESHIELRKYPRLKIPYPDIVVKIETLKGHLKDISLGGCRVQLEKPISPYFLEKGFQKIVEIELPNGKTFKVKAKIVNVMFTTKQISCAFSEKSENVIKLYREVIDYLRKKLEEWD